jgi:SAM-dependent methyltransferase
MSNSEVFGQYSEYYDLLYRDKDYQAEVEYINNLIVKNCNKPQTILDLGCGTGKHDFLLNRMGYKITGVDLSEKMISIANSNINEKNDNLNFLVGDVRNLDLSSKFDVVISLFHVASYQISNTDIKSFIRTAKNHLKPGGKLIFDFWYGPAVYSDKPSLRKKRIENSKLLIDRKTTPTFDCNKNKVEVHFEISIENKTSKRKIKFEETHLMRFFFLPELELLLNIEGFRLINSYKWMSNQNLSCDAWYGVIIAEL